MWLGKITLFLYSFKVIKTVFWINLLHVGTLLNTILYKHKETFYVKYKLKLSTVNTCDTCDTCIEIIIRWII